MSRFALRLLVLLATTAGAAQASTVAVTAPTFGVEAGQGWTLGYSFVVNQNLTVTHLGLVDVGPSGFPSDTPVGLWTDSGTLLATAIVSDAAPLVEGAHFVALGSTLELLAGATYRIASNNFPGNENVYFSASGHTVAPEITLTGNAYLQSVGNPDDLVFPTQFSSSNQFKYLGATFMFGAASAGVPEPATGALLGLAMIGFAAARRRAPRTMRAAPPHP